jgi:D-alanine-D-alanine ligase
MDQIGVCYGGPSPEHDISILTGLQVARVLHDAGHDVVGLYWTKTGDWLLVPALLEASDFVQGKPPKSSPTLLQTGLEGGFIEDSRKRKRIDVGAVVNCCHGGPGENGTLQASLDLCGIAYTGPSAAGAALGMDKLATNAVARAAGVEVNRQFVVGAVDDTATGPFIVKPRRGGSSIGIEVVDDVTTAQRLATTSAHFADGAVIEPYLDGWIDLNISARSHPSLELSPIEKPVRGETRVYSYQEKYLSSGGPGLEHAPRELPADIPSAIATAITDAAHALAEPLLVRGVARLDFLWDGNDRVLFNEINTIPGAMSLYLWQAGGHKYAEICEDLIAEARAQGSVRWNVTGADGSALRSAGQIAAKLA